MGPPSRRAPEPVRGEGGGRKAPAVPPEMKVLAAIGKHQKLLMILGEARVLSYWEDGRPAFRREAT
jgi:hypothetical protein